MATKGDKCLKLPLNKMAENCFVEELEEALFKGEIDLIVHSYKDLSLTKNKEFPVVVVSKREDPRDVFVSPLIKSSIHKGKPIGCSSFRRQFQLQSLGEDGIIEPIRGDVITRLKKLDQGEYRGLVLAAAGLKRLGLENRISKYFSIEEMLPSPCQGILAVQGRLGLEYSFLKDFHCSNAAYIAKGERSFAKAIPKSGYSEIAAFGEIIENRLNLTGLGFKKGRIIKATVVGDLNEGESLGKQLASLLETEVEV